MDPLTCHASTAAHTPGTGQPARLDQLVLGHSRIDCQGPRFTDRYLWRSRDSRRLITKRSRISRRKTIGNRTRKSNTLSCCCTLSLTARIRSTTRTGMQNKRIRKNSEGEIRVNMISPLIPVPRTGAHTLLIPNAAKPMYLAAIIRATSSFPIVAQERIACVRVYPWARHTRHQRRIRVPACVLCTSGRSQDISHGRYNTRSRSGCGCAARKQSQIGHCQPFQGLFTRGAEQSLRISEPDRIGRTSPVTALIMTHRTAFGLSLELPFHTINRHRTRRNRRAGRPDWYGT